LQVGGMGHPQKVGEPPCKQGQGHDDPMGGQGYGFPKCQEITHADGDTRESEHHRDHKVERIPARDTGPDDEIGGRKPEGDPEKQGDSAEEEGVFNQTRAFQKD